MQTAEALEGILAELREARQKTKRELDNLALDFQAPTLAGLMRNYKAFRLKESRLKEELAAYDILEPALAVKLKQAKAEEAGRTREAAREELRQKEREILESMAGLSPAAKARALSSLAQLRRREVEL